MWIWVRRWDGIRVGGWAVIEEREAGSGRLLACERVKNGIFPGGLGMLIDRINAGANGGMSFAVGTDSTAFNAAQTGLLAEVFRAGVASLYRSGSTWIIQHYLSEADANGFSLVEAGLRDDVLGVFLGRFVHAAKAKTSSNTITYTWNVPFAAA